MELHFLCGPITSVLGVRIVDRLLTIATGLQLFRGVLLEPISSAARCQKGKWH